MDFNGFFVDTTAHVYELYTLIAIVALVVGCVVGFFMGEADMEMRHGRGELRAPLPTVDV